MSNNASSRVVSCRVPITSYIEMLQEAKDQSMSISDYVLLKMLGQVDDKSLLEIADLQKENQSLIASINSYKNQLTKDGQSSNQEIKNLKSELRKSKKIGLDWEEYAHKLEKDVNNLNSRLDTSKSSNESVKKSSKTEVSKLKTEIVKLKSELRTLKSDIRAKEHKLVLSNADVSIGNNEIESLKIQLEKANKRIKAANDYCKEQAVGTGLFDNNYVQF